MAVSKWRFHLPPSRDSQLYPVIFATTFFPFYGADSKQGSHTKHKLTSHRTCTSNNQPHSINSSAFKTRKISAPRLYFFALVGAHAVLPRCCRCRVVRRHRRRRVASTRPSSHHPPGPRLALPFATPCRPNHVLRTPPPHPKPSFISVGHTFIDAGVV